MTNSVSDPIKLEVECKVHTIHIDRRVFFLYEYNNGRYLDYVIRDTSGHVIERHTPEYVEVGKVFVDNSDEFI